MKTLLILIIILAPPFFMNAQKFNPAQIKPSYNTVFPMEDRNPKLPKQSAIKPLYRSPIENLEAKLAKENCRLTKLAKKVWKKEDDYKEKQECLKNLENTAEDRSDQKIETAKKQIAKFQDKLNEAKKEVELSLKKVEKIEKKIEEAKFTRHD